MDKSPKVLAMVMAGGMGKRLMPLTRDRSKPAVPFGGKYRIIDFVLSNLVNSGITSIYVLTQYKSQSLLRHLSDGWSVRDARDQEFITAVPAQMRVGEEWYQGTADSIYQNLYLIDNHNPDIVAVFGSDHVYRMDVNQVIKFHLEKEADVTIIAVPRPREESIKFGSIVIDNDSRAINFQEKTPNAIPMPTNPNYILASMGNYIFKKDFLVKILTSDEFKNCSDFGRDIFPKIHEKYRVYVYDFTTNNVPGTVKSEERGYWRDIGTIKVYYEANMDLRAVEPIFNLYNKEWPLRTANYNDPPAKFVLSDPGRTGVAINSIVSEGCIISGARVENSVLGRLVRIDESYVTESVIMDRTTIGYGCRIRRAIIDKNTQIFPGVEIGYDLEKDKQRFTVDEESGVVVIPRNSIVKK